MVATYMRIDTTAMSLGYIESTKTTPMMYQMTPFVCFCSKQENNHERLGSAKKNATEAEFEILRVKPPAETNLFAFAHEEPEAPLVKSLETWGV